MSEHVIELTDATFKDGVAKGVALVDFYGTWCPPCKLLEPVVEKLAADYAGRAVVAKLNVDENNDAAADSAVEDIPTIVLFRDGEAKGRLFGAQDYETVAGELNRLLT